MQHVNGGEPWALESNPDMNYIVLPLTSYMLLAKLLIILILKFLISHMGTMTP